MLSRFVLFLPGLLAAFPLLSAETALVRIGESWRYFKAAPRAAAPDADWRRLDFDDSSWPQGRSDLVLPEDESPAELARRGRDEAPVFIRKKFVVNNPASIRWLVLLVEHRKGFVAYLNGVPIARRHEPGVVVREGKDGEIEHEVHPASIDISNFRDRLVRGENVLAVEGIHSAQTDSEFSLAVALTANFSRGPFVQNATTSSIQIIWRTPEAADSTVEFGPTGSLGNTVSDSSMVTDHVMTLTGLSANTRYYYRVNSSDGDSTVQSDVESFQTLKSDGPVRFVVLGDSGGGTVAQARVATVMRNLFPELVLHCGDIIYGGFTDGTVDTRFFNYYQGQAKNTPFYTTIGNHDLNCCDEPFDFNTNVFVLNATNYQNAFYLPTNSLTGTEHFYSFDHGDAHFVSLFNPWFQHYVFTNTSEQYLWLTNDLARSTKPWKILFFHNPVANSGFHASRDYNSNSILDRVEVMDLMVPLRQYGLDLVLCGHDHNFERFAPTNGFHYAVVGGGGYSTYPFTERHPGSAQWWSVFHCAKIEIQGETLTVHAVGTNGVVFDSMTIRRTLTAAHVYQAAWNTPVIESNQGSNDGNIVGQTFDFAGAPILTRAGDFSNLGRVFVNNDSTNLYVGFDQAMFYQNNNIFLFVESPRQAGVDTMAGVGNGLIDPTGQGADGLDCLENLSFTNFAPSIGCILGDEFADGQARNFARTNLDLNIGQGIYRLNAGLSNVAGVRLQQFNRSPQTSGTGAGEQNADLIELMIPFSALGGVQPGDIIKIGALVGGYEFDPLQQTRQLDKAALAAFVSGFGQEPVVLEGVSVRLAFPPNLDSDGDGLPDTWELAHDLNPNSAADDNGSDGDPDHDDSSNMHEFLANTDPRDADSVLRVSLVPVAASRYRLSWRAVTGRRYHLEYASGPDLSFRAFSGSGWPRTAISAQEIYEDDVSTNMPPPDVRAYRVRLAP